MKKFFYYLTIILIFFKTNLLFSQNFRKIDYSNDYLIEYTINNIEMKKAIDSLISETKSCTYYKLHPYLISICIYDSSKFNINSVPYSTTVIHNRRIDPRTKEEGICIYNNQTIFIESYEINQIKFFFETKNKKKKFCYKNSENLLDQLPFATLTFSNTYQIDSGKLVLTDSDREYSTGYIFEYCYIIKKGDTWIDISKKIKCNVEDLKKEFAEMNTPLVGYILMVVYKFENGKLTGISRQF